MNRGIRLTTGVEFARRDAPPRPIQIERALPRARSLFPLGEAVDAQPWMGARPCLPDMLPVIGKAPRHPGLWFDFGHQHHGLTLGPATGRLLAEMMTGDDAFCRPEPVCRRALLVDHIRLWPFGRLASCGGSWRYWCPGSDIAG